ncbi:MAG: single-stranded DNA-binding protein [Pyrinomonadaceae bacterium]|nr:single-stranded DNA-binding protein [Pyrinomonadaceae bacterium]
MSYNKITVIGNLGKDPELRYTPQGDAVCDFSVAVNDRKRDKSGDYQDVTTWFRVTTWRKMAENASKYLSKGRQVYVEGRLQVDEWQDRDGKDRFTLNIQASEVQFLGGGRTDEFGGDNVEQMQSSAPSGAVSSQDSPSDDDIPF